jgi:hypothetical protein
MNLPVPNRVTEADALSPPTTPFTTPSQVSLRKALTVVGGKPALMGGLIISPKGRRGLVDSASTLRQRLTAGLGERPAVAAELAKLVMALPKQDPGVGVPIVAEAYLDAMGDAPAWAVRAARLRFMRGEALGLNQSFAPTPPQFANLVRSILAPLRKDLADLESLASIDAEPEAAEKARVLEGLDKFRAELGQVAKAMP